MKKYIRILPFTGLAASIALGGSLSAQTSSDRTNVRDQQRQSQTGDRNVETTRTGQAQSGQARQDQDRYGQARTGQDRQDSDRSERVQSRPMKASDITGMNINSGSDEKIGEIDKIYIDSNSGEVLALVVSTGGFLGMGQDQTLISPEDLRFGDDRSLLKADLTKDQIRSAPRYDSDDRASLDRVRPLGNTGSDWDRRQERSDRMQTRPGAGQTVADRGTSGNEYSDRTGRTDQADRRDTRSAAGTTGQTASQQRTSRDDHSDRTNQRMDAQSERRQIAVSDLIGMSVENRQGESVGDIDEVFVDLENREVAGVVVSTGGFLGMGDRKTLFGMQELSIDHDNERVIVNYNRDQIRTFAQYRENDETVFESLRQRTDRLDPRAAASAREGRWDDQRSTDRSRDDQSRYDETRTDQSSTDGARTEARNVGSAALGRSSDMTVFSQGNSSEEIAMTASIRTALREDRALSSRANNVTIITQGNRVLLRGEVDSESEKSAVEAIARNKAGRQNVNSELTVRGR